MTAVTLSRVTDWAALGERWRDFEARSDCSFFQSWTWVGCLAEQRFSDPVLLEATLENRVVAMALFNRRRGPTGRETLWLGESGVSEIDTIYVEYNGILAAGSTSADLLAGCLRAARRAPLDGDRRPYRARRLVLSGVDEAGLAAALTLGRGVWIRNHLPAPHIDLDRIRADDGGFLAGISANARYQLRRSDRAYQAAGELAVQRAGTVAEAQAFLAELAALHQESWNRRGRPGAFASPWFGRFHSALIERGFPRGEIEFLRITSAGKSVGMLYNFRYRGQVLAYQSGFAYTGAERHQKPGLTSHHLAIAMAISGGDICYNFLAGSDRYKRSLSNAEDQLFWLQIGAGWQIRRCVGWLRGRLGPRLRAAAGRLHDAATIRSRPGRDAP